MRSLNTAILKDFSVVVPRNKEEQIAVAQTLSNVDIVIRHLSMLTEKKKNIKHGAMQALLTGKIKLPGFSREWIKKKLADIGYFKGGNGFPLEHQGNKQGKYPFYKVSDMNNLGNETFMFSSNNYVDEDDRQLIGAFLFPKGTIIFAKIGAAIFLERKKILSREACIDNNMMGFVIENPEANVRFFITFLRISP